MAAADDPDAQTPRAYPLTGRFRLAPAPAGLRLAQDLVNTSLAEPLTGTRRDLLADPDDARAWLAETLEQWSAATGQQTPHVTVSADDLPALRDLRERLRAALRASSDNAEPPGPAGADGADGADGTAFTAQLEVALAPDGQVAYGPQNVDGRAVAALVTAEALLAQATGTWTRLKTCAHAPCGACFYDASPNRSRAWHDTKTCGNINNLRASRTRRRADA
jgi:predicted RNA-binding Zn ribbon-like protein